MKHLQKHIPVILLSINLIYLFIKGHSVAGSLVVGFLCGLYAYQLYLNSKDIPNYEELFRNKLNEMNNNYNKRLDEIEDEMSKISLSVSRIPSTTNKKPTQRINF